MRKETINLIFGLKIKMLRQARGMSLKDLATASGTVQGFLSDIEKGKKYPSTEKIMDLATAFGTTYDYLVSIMGDKRLLPVVDLLESDFMQNYPLEKFGIKPYNLIELFQHDPQKTGAFVGTAMRIMRNHHLTTENLYGATLRSYQHLHDNHFSEIEDAARRAAAEWHLPDDPALPTARLESILLEKYSVPTRRDGLSQMPELRSIRSYFSQKCNVFFLNSGLSRAQEKFLLGRELGFRYMGLNPRAYETVLSRGDNFELLLNNFQASYFASALLMDEERFRQDLAEVFASYTWQPERWMALLSRYDVTPEMLMQRITNVLPGKFGFSDLFFIRINGNSDLTSFEMTKELHVGGLQSPYATEANEHYCRRWLSIGILRTLRTAPHGLADGIVCDAQLSTYHGTENTYLCISMAKRRDGRAESGVSVTLGLKVDEKLRHILRFADDPAIRRKTVNTTCETCPIADCGARAAAPTEVDRLRKRAAVEEALGQL